MADPRFEVPPEYADVYERAFRAAYEHRHGEETDEPPPRRSDVRVPRQRRDATPADPPGEDAGEPRSTLRSPSLRGTRDALKARDAELRAAPQPGAEPDDGFGGAKRHRGGSALLPLVLLTLLSLVALGAAFGLGWLSSGLG